MAKTKKATRPKKIALQDIAGKKLEEMTLFSIRNLATPLRPGPEVSAKKVPQAVRTYRFIDFDDKVPELPKFFLGALTTFYYDTWIKAFANLQGVQSELLSHVLSHIKGEYAFSLSFIMGPKSFSESVQELKAAAEQSDPVMLPRAVERYMQRGKRLMTECRLFLKLAAASPEVKKQKGAAVCSLLLKSSNAAAKVLKDFTFDKKA